MTSRGPGDNLQVHFDTRSYELTRSGRANLLPSRRRHSFLPMAWLSVRFGRVRFQKRPAQFVALLPARADALAQRPQIHRFLEILRESRFATALPAPRFVQRAYNKYRNPLGRRLRLQYL